MRKYLLILLLLVMGGCQGGMHSKKIVPIRPVPYASLSTNHLTAPSLSNQSSPQSVNRPNTPQATKQSIVINGTQKANTSKFDINKKAAELHVRIPAVDQGERVAQEALAIAAASAPPEIKIKIKWWRLILFYSAVGGLAAVIWIFCYRKTRRKWGHWRQRYRTTV